MAIFIKMVINPNINDHLYRHYPRIGRSVNCFLKKNIRLNPFAVAEMGAYFPFGNRHASGHLGQGRAIHHAGDKISGVQKDRRNRQTGSWEHRL